MSFFKLRKNKGQYIKQKKCQYKTFNFPGIAMKSSLINLRKIPKFPLYDTRNKASFRSSMKSSARLCRDKAMMGEFCVRNKRPVTTSVTSNKQRENLTLKNCKSNNNSTMKSRSKAILNIPYVEFNDDCLVDKK